jgi:phosphatidylserine synthase
LAIKHPELEVVRATSIGISDLRSMVAAIYTVSECITIGQSITVDDVSGWFFPGAPSPWNAAYNDIKNL